MKKGLKFGLVGTGGSEVWRGSIDVDVVLMFWLPERGGWGMDCEFERRRLRGGRFGGGSREGEVDAAVRAGLGAGGDVEEEGGSLPGGGADIEALVDMMC